MYEILYKIEQFYLSSFWINRYFRRIKEENEEDMLLKARLVIHKIAQELTIQLYTGNIHQDGRSYKGYIEINNNRFPWKDDPEYMENTIIHEFGHLLYLEDDFKLIMDLNNIVLHTAIFNKNVRYKSSPSPSLKKSDSFYDYIADTNELRLRIIPLVKYMYDNGFTAEETYDKYCKYDNVFDFYTRDLLIYWIDNIL